MAKRLLDEYGGTRVWWHTSPDGEVTVERESDDTVELQIAKDMTDLGGPMVDTDGMRLQRIIPSSVMNQAMLEGWFHDPAAWKRWANGETGMAFAIEHNGRKQKL